MTDKSPTYDEEITPFPLMEATDLCQSCRLKDRQTPTEVWTGSFNISNTAARSLENAVVIKNEEIAQGYFEYYQDMLKISEPLDWSSHWVQPSLGAKV